MKIINVTRYYDRIYEIIVMSGYYKVPILTATESSKEHIVAHAAELGVSIPPPMSLADLNNGGFKHQPESVYVNDALEVLAAMMKRFYGQLEIEAVTFAVPE